MRWRILAKRAGRVHHRVPRTGADLRADYAPNYYATFLFDPDGNTVEAVCLK